MSPRYGYVSLNNKLVEVWNSSLKYWSLSKKFTIKENSSFLTKEFAKMHLSRPHALSQSEDYYIKLVPDPSNSNITHLKIYFEPLTGSIGRMERMMNDWIRSLASTQITFQRRANKEIEAYFNDELDELHKREIKEEEEEKKKAKFCSFCGEEVKPTFKFCLKCGSKLD